MSPNQFTEVRGEAASCTRCQLYKNATQTVFGEGPVPAHVMFVGEQPGDQEDLQGHPFVGPAGRMLDTALKEAGVDRYRTYVTNAVKHFKFEPRGKRRIHQKPDRTEIEACKYWLVREIDIVNPRLVVALGATAGRALMGKVVTIGRERGSLKPFPGDRELLVTIHPSALLRMDDAAAKQAAYEQFVSELRMVADAVARHEAA
jgi:uracil-DNA glycosylase